MAVKEQERNFVIAAHQEGKFVALTPTQRIILELWYMGEIPRTPKEIGTLLDPPKKQYRVIEIRLDALRVLEDFDRLQINTLGLSGRVKNAVVRNLGNVSPAELVKLTDEELMKMRGIGAMVLHEIRTNLLQYTE